MKASKVIIIVFLIGVAAIVALLWAGKIDNTITQEDKIYIDSIMQHGHSVVPDFDTYQDEIGFIMEVQRTVLEVAPVGMGIPENRNREPKDLYEFREGLCFDRSRVIEKILRSHGFETRHVSIFSTEKSDGSSIKALASTSTESHAVSEVKTSKGWLLIDSNDPWIAIDKNMEPYDAAAIKEAYEKGSADWYSDYETHVSPIYKHGFAHVYGLYSRHGRFYPPYNFVPDIELNELRENL